ncbi:TetR/AcrR family transcriptional regulator [Antrihabitans cavernicola]|uniref:TetR/AcrR family transcriptional regulator n=1 Tax=Antrihabitans cavernicola TaxID=2495913 RepID=A0A5A7SK38_9NOCA|nr:TetR/AcrR family transcriptional regulator [Spelaeibacter cavernicola]KAA0024815.1 TetR/AcrR family transcriptional regulator [Spelaeibacter cavernicola]
MARPREFTTDDVVAKAMDCFWNGSYAGTSTEDLCRSTGLSRSSLYNTFKSKNEIYRQALQRYGVAKDVERQAYLTRTGTGRELLRALLDDVIVGQFDVENQRSCMVVNAAVEVGRSDAEIAGLARHSLAEFHDLLVVLIDRGRLDGTIADGPSSDELADVVHATLNGLQVAARVADSDAANRRAVDTLMGLIR